MRRRRPVWISHVPRATLRACRSHYPGGSRRTLRFGSTRSGLLRFVGGSASATSLSRPAQDSHAKDNSFAALRPARSLPRQTRGINLEASAPAIARQHRPKRYRGVPKTPRTGLTPAGHTRLRGAQRSHFMSQNVPECPNSERRSAATPPPPQVCQISKRTAMSAGLSRFFFRQWLLRLRNGRRCATSIFTFFRRRASTMAAWIGRGRLAPTPHRLKRRRSFHTAIRGACS